MTDSITDPLPTAPPRVRVCALVVTFNRAPMLADALGALVRQSRLPDHVLVVDNASTDETPGVLASAGVEVLRMERNEGASGGFAAGLAHAAAQGWDWIWMMDDDVLPAPDALAQMLGAGLHLDPAVVGITGVKTGVDGRVQATHAGTYDVARMQYRGHAWPLSPAPIEVEYASFVGLMVRGDVTRTVGPRADFFHWHDDIEYTLRLARHGRLMLVPGARVVHRDSEAGGGYRNRLGRRVPVGGTWRVYYALRNRMLTNRAHGTSAQRAAGAVWATLYLARGLGAALVYHRGEARSRRLRLLVTAYRDGWLGRSGMRVPPSKG